MWAKVGRPERDDSVIARGRNTEESTRYVRVLSLIRERIEILNHGGFWSDMVSKRVEKVR